MTDCSIERDEWKLDPETSTCRAVQTNYCCITRMEKDTHCTVSDATSLVRGLRAPDVRLVVDLLLPKLGAVSQNPTPNRRDNFEYKNQVFPLGLYHNAVDVGVLLFLARPSHLRNRMHMYNKTAKLKLHNHILWLVQNISYCAVQIYYSDQMVSE